MTITDFVWLSIGESLLAMTFALGIFVGIALTKRSQGNGDDDEGA